MWSDFSGWKRTTLPEDFFKFWKLRHLENQGVAWFILIWRCYKLLRRVFNSTKQIKFHLLRVDAGVHSLPRRKRGGELLLNSCLAVAALGRGSCCIERSDSLDHWVWATRAGLEARQRSSAQLRQWALRKQPNEAAARQGSSRVRQHEHQNDALAALLPHMDTGGQASGDGPSQHARQLQQVHGHWQLPATANCANADVQLGERQQISADKTVA